MKKVLPALVLSLILIQLMSIPAIGRIDNGFINPVIVTTQPATSITPNSAQLNATITWPSIGMNNHAGNLKPVSYDDELQVAIIPSGTGYFRYGTSSAALTQSTPRQTLPWGTASLNAQIVGLFPCTTYYFQPVVEYNIVIDNYQPFSSSYLIALTSPDGRQLSSGLGIGLNRLLPDRISRQVRIEVQTGAILYFTTTGCVTGSHNAALVGPGGAVGISNILVSTATISATRVAPGEKVDITAMVTNRGTANGESKIILYVNGAQVESKGVTLASGQTAPVHFYISENEPGTYNVHVGGVSAGSFTVDAFSSNDILIYGIVVLFTIAIAGTLFLLVRKRPV